MSLLNKIDTESDSTPVKDVSCFKRSNDKRKRQFLKFKKDTYQTIDQDDDDDDDDDDSFFSNNDELEITTTINNNNLLTSNTNNNLIQNKSSNIGQLLDMELHNLESMINEPIIEPIKDDSNVYRSQFEMDLNYNNNNNDNNNDNNNISGGLRRRRVSRDNQIDNNNIGARRRHFVRSHTDRLVEAIEALRYSIHDNTQLQARLVQHKRFSGSSHVGGSSSRRKSMYHQSGGGGGSSGSRYHQQQQQQQQQQQLQIQSQQEGASGGVVSATATPSSIRHATKTISIGSGDESLKVRKDKVAVELRVVFLKIGEIDTLKELYHADAFIQAKWREPKLDGFTAEQLTLIDLEKYWSPLLYIDNILSETKDAQWLASVVNDMGEVTVIERRRIKGVFLETLELNDFPLDVQDLTITMTSERPDSEVDLIPDQAEMSAINMQTFVDQQEWKLHEHVEITKRIVLQEYSSTMKSHPCLSVTCRAARRPGYFYWNVFLIMFMISGLSFATFSVSPEKAQYRLRLSFTLVLTSVTFKYVITQSLPKISYLTYMDKYVLMSLAILCIVSIWHACVTIIPQGPGLFTPRHRNKSEMFHSLYSTTPSAGSTLAPRLIRSNYSLYNPQVQKQLSEKSVFLKSFLKTVNSEVDPSQSTDSSNSVNVEDDIDDSLYDDKSDDSDDDEDGNKRLTTSEINTLKSIERDVLISFGSLYILAHLIFIFWLYFDASKRRRIMKQKDKDYREFLQRNRDWQKSQMKRQQEKRISLTTPGIITPGSSGCSSVITPMKPDMSTRYRGLIGVGSHSGGGGDLELITTTAAAITSSSDKTQITPNTTNTATYHKVQRSSGLMMKPKVSIMTTSPHHHHHHQSSGTLSFSPPVSAGLISESPDKASTGILKKNQGYQNAQQKHAMKKLRPLRCTFDEK